VSAREEVLARVRAALAPSVGTDVAIPREYRARTDDDLSTFLERLRDYGAGTARVDAAALDAAVREALRARGARRVVAPEGVPGSWLEGFEVLRDAPALDPHDLDAADAVVTTCAIAIAQTGTIVLDGTSPMGRRVLTLVPDHHVCVVRTDQVVGSIPEALARLDPVRPLTFVSGPSATVDIEMVRVQGVHGPRRLDVLVVDAGPPTDRPG
jgi:L-lactate dehydrogenase complex protein LldG